MRRGVVWITGGSSGIGRAIALELVAAGWRVGVGARREEELQRLADASDRPIITGRLDVCSPSSVSEWGAHLRERLGEPDALVVCAGWGLAKTIEETDEAIWNRTVETNLTGLYRAVREVLPGMLGRGVGHIVAILSVASRTAFPNNTAYCASKYGALGFIEALRAEIRDRGVRVTAVLPGATDTPYWDRQPGEWDRSRMIEPKSVACAVQQALESDRSALVEEIRLAPPGGNL